MVECKTCSAKDTCDTCEENREMTKEKTCVCKTGSYEIKGVGVCPLCHYSCLTCADPKASSASLNSA